VGVQVCPHHNTRTKLRNDEGFAFRRRVFVCNATRALHRAMRCHSFRQGGFAPLRYLWAARREWAYGVCPHNFIYYSCILTTRPERQGGDAIKCLVHLSVLSMTRNEEGSPSPFPFDRAMRMEPPSSSLPFDATQRAEILPSSSFSF